MTEHELRSEVHSLVLHRAKSNKQAEIIRDAVMRMSREFAAAQVAEKDVEITELARKLEIQDTMHQNAEAALREENKRLREGVRKALKYIEGPHHSNPEPIAIYEILQPLISPSDGYMKSICTTCELTIEECECYFDSDDDANTHTKRVPSDGDGAKNNENNGNNEL